MMQSHRPRNFISASEKDGSVQNDPSWALEGTAYCAWTTQ
jgi:hypothetical protein